jgi:hypothetical protein
MILDELVSRREARFINLHCSSVSDPGPRPTFIDRSRSAGRSRPPYQRGEEAPPTAAELDGRSRSCVRRAGGGRSSALNDSQSPARRKSEDRTPSGPRISRRRHVLRRSTPSDRGLQSDEVGFRGHQAHQPLDHGLLAVGTATGLRAERWWKSGCSGRVDVCQSRIAARNEQPGGPFVK